MISDQNTESGEPLEERVITKSDFLHQLKDMKAHHIDKLKEIEETRDELKFYTNEGHRIKYYETLEGVRYEVLERLPLGFR